MRKIETSVEYNNMVSESRSMGESKDCSVKAVALAANCSYQAAHEVLRLKGRKHGRGAYHYQVTSSVEAFGKKLMRVDVRTKIAQYPGAHKNLKNATTYHPVRFNKVWADGKTYLVFVAGHVLVIKNGVTMDWTNDKAKQIVTLYEVV